LNFVFDGKKLNRELRQTTREEIDGVGRGRMGDDQEAGKELSVADEEAILLTKQPFEF
jgi:hypothetical protein